MKCDPFSKPISVKLSLNTLRGQFLWPCSFSTLRNFPLLSWDSYECKGPSHALCFASYKSMRQLFGPFLQHVFFAEEQETLGSSGGWPYKGWRHMKCWLAPVVGDQAQWLQGWRAGLTWSGATGVTHWSEWANVGMAGWVPIPLLQKRYLHHGEASLPSHSGCHARHYNSQMGSPARGKASGRRRCWAGNTWEHPGAPFL